MDTAVSQNNLACSFFRVREKNIKRGERPIITQSVKQKNNKEHLYIYLHIPKCGGTTLTYHLEQNFPKDELMPLYASKFYNHNNGEFENIIEPKSINHYLQNLPEEKKNKVRFIYGHLAYYGIHEYFSRPYRYITFLRDPLTRVISTYYQYLRRHQKKLPLAPWRKELPPGFGFEEWLGSGEPRTSDYMTNFLSQNSEYYDWNELKMTNNHLTRAKAILEKMFFVGLAERANIDFLYLFDLFDVKKYFENRNVTTQNIIEVNEKLSNIVISKNIIDRELYNYAVLLNVRAKKKRPNFLFRVSRAYLRRVRSIIINPERINFTNA